MIAAVGVAAVATAACGEVDTLPATIEGGVPAATQRTLPLQQYSMQDLCPELSGRRGVAGDRLRTARAAELRALVAAYRRYGPTARVRTSYAPAHERGIRYEEIKLRELAEGHLESLRLTNCSPSAQRTLTALLESG